MSRFREMIEMIRMALNAVRTHVLRSSLTILGIFIGVFSIIAVMTGIRVLQSNLETAMSGLGANTFQFQRFPAIRFDDNDWEKYLRRRRFYAADMKRVQEKSTLAQAVSATASFGVGEASSKFARTNPNISAVGVTPDGFITQSWTVESGRGFSEADDISGRRVCVLGADLAEKLFPLGSPVGQPVKFLGISYNVIGLLARRGSLFGQSRDNFIAIPLGTALRLYGQKLSLTIQVQAPGRETYQDVLEQARGAMRRVEPGIEDDFELVSNESSVGQFRSLTSAIRLGAAALSSIALLAAGIGIMNIMLVSVTERTREIGIRRAIGARKRSVMIQFVAEAILLSEIGGVLGVIAGIAFGNLICFFMQVTPIIPFDLAAIGLGICSAVGIIFGTYPAWKAANLDPIDSLRYE
ncbi:MAG: FtsX-like permease family protein [Pedosphaera sp.]|nr:FtsX-like permease family protein [Pedosphaera sp.]